MKYAKYILTAVGGFVAGVLFLDKKHNLGIVEGIKESAINAASAFRRKSESAENSVNSADSAEVAS